MLQTTGSLCTTVSLEATSPRQHSGLLDTLGPGNLKTVWNYSGNSGFRFSSRAPSSPLSLFTLSSSLSFPPSPFLLLLPVFSVAPVEPASCFFTKFSGHFQDNLECLPVQGQYMCLQGINLGYLSLLRRQETWVPQSRAPAPMEKGGWPSLCCPGCSHFLNHWELLEWRTKARA